MALNYEPLDWDLEERNHLLGEGALHDHHIQDPTEIAVEADQ